MQIAKMSLVKVYSLWNSWCHTSSDFILVSQLWSLGGQTVAFYFKNMSSLLLGSVEPRLIKSWNKIKAVGKEREKLIITSNKLIVFAKHKLFSEWEILKIEIYIFGWNSSKAVDTANKKAQSDTDFILENVDTQFLQLWCSYWPFY